MDASLYEQHDRCEARHWWFRGRRACVEAVLEAQLLPRPGRRLLDVGAGMGGMLLLLSRFGQVEGAEFAPAARERARQRFPGFTVHPCALPHQLPPGRWDVVTCFDVLEHVEEPLTALETMRSRLTTGGQLVVTVPAFEFLWSAHDDLNQHLRRYTAGSLRAELEAAGFRVKFLSYYNTALFPAVAAVRVARTALARVWPEHAAHSDLSEVAWPVNAVLGGLFGAEARALRRGTLPVGVSLIAVTEGL